MISSQEEDEFVAVRVQDPRLQNEGSWNSYVDYKIFLHTNSKAFTAKTSCVRRRYSEFAWLKKKLQKNAGLVPVPDLPGKSFFSFSNEDFLEKRRKGLQAFLDSVVNMTVCLSDSQLHLFLQTQLPVGHIQDCVQGHTPYSVTDAILTYASSNRGLAQAQEEDAIKEPSLTVSYESMESPAPHLPCLQPAEPFSPELLSCADPDPLEGLLELSDPAQQQEKSSIRVLQRDNHLEAVVEGDGPTEATFFLGDVPESLGLEDGAQQRSCRIQAAVEVHSPMGAGFEEPRGVDGLFQECSAREESDLRSGSEEKTETEGEKVHAEPETRENAVAILYLNNEAGSQEEVLEGAVETVPHPDTEEIRDDQLERSQHVQVEKCENSLENVALKQSDVKEQETGSEEVLEVVCCEKQDVENQDIQEVCGLEQQEQTVPDPDTEEEDQPESSGEVNIEKVEIPHLKDSELKEQATESNSKSQEEVACSKTPGLESHGVNGLEQSAEDEDVSSLQEFRSSDREGRNESESESKEAPSVHSVPEEERRGEEQERTKEDSDDDSGSSSNESIVKVSDEEEQEEQEEASPAANGFLKPEQDVPRWSQVEASSRNILELQVKEDGDLQLITSISDLSNSLDLNAADLTENSDISILEM